MNTRGMFRVRNTKTTRATILASCRSSLFLVLTLSLWGSISAYYFGGGADSARFSYNCFTKSKFQDKNSYTILIKCFWSKEEYFLILRTPSKPQKPNLEN